MRTQWHGQAVVAGAGSVELFGSWKKLKTNFVFFFFENNAAIGYSVLRRFYFDGFHAEPALPSFGRYQWPQQVVLYQWQRYDAANHLVGSGCYCVGHSV